MREFINDGLHTITNYFRNCRIRTYRRFCRNVKQRHLLSNKTPSKALKMMLSKNFSLDEFINSNTAKRLCIENTPNYKQKESLKRLCDNVLQPLRDILGQIRISSGFRHKLLNSAINGAYLSQHTKGEAADCNYYINGDKRNDILFTTIIENELPFDQLINEFDYSWIHISHKEKNNRKQILQAVKLDGEVKYIDITSNYY